MLVQPANKHSLPKTLPLVHNMNRTVGKFMLHVAFRTLTHNRVLPAYVNGGT
jgi:hypothetical protein